jgi:anthranilate synthase/aminodeoxychorismate synthase-like glutamine amidotransferase
LTTLVVIDNYDSFTYNLVQMFMTYDLSIRVYRNDRITVPEVAGMRPDYLLISPGPKDPLHAGISMSLIREMYRNIPILGVCLGMQCINEVFGGETVQALTLMHGKTSRVLHDDDGIFHGLPAPFTAARYHSLMTAPSSPELMVTSRSDDGVIMGLSHVEYPLHGVQFHPESFLTPNGPLLVKNFLRLGPLKESLDDGYN